VKQPSMRLASLEPRVQSQVVLDARCLLCVYRDRQEYARKQKEHFCHDQEHEYQARTSKTLRQFAAHIVNTPNIAAVILMLLPGGRTRSQFMYLRGGANCGEQARDVRPPQSLYM